MTRLTRAIPYGFVIVSVVAFAWGVLLSGKAPLGERSESALQIEEPIKTFREAMAGSEFSITFTLKNRGDGPIHVVGSDGFCSQTGCLTTEGLPMDIPADESRDVRLTVKAGAPGVFRGKIVLYVAGFGGYREIVLEVKGHICGSET